MGGGLRAAQGGVWFMYTFMYLVVYANARVMGHNPVIITSLLPSFHLSPHTFILPAFTPSSSSTPSFHPSSNHPCHLLHFLLPFPSPIPSSPYSIHLSLIIRIISTLRFCSHYCICLSVVSLFIHSVLIHPCFCHPILLFSSSLQSFFLPDVRLISLRLFHLSPTVPHPIHPSILPLIPLGLFRSFHTSSCLLCLCPSIRHPIVLFPSVNPSSFAPSLPFISYIRPASPTSFMPRTSFPHFLPFSRLVAFLPAGMHSLFPPGRPLLRSIFTSLSLSSSLRCDGYL